LNAGFRCAADSLARDEPLAGTASTYRSFLLIECGGPWGVDSLRDCRLPPAVTGPLAARCREHKVRPLLIRRHGRARSGHGRVFASHADRSRSWLETTRVDDPHELLDLDLEGLSQGRSPGLTPCSEPLFLVCTHGKHDVCCAEQGRPAAKALTAVHPEQTWEVSHIGGDRFAGNMLILPDALYYGRLTPTSAVSVVETHLRGALALDHLRGRSTYGFAVQAAEVYLRRRLERSGRGDAVLRAVRRDGELTEATFESDGEAWEVRVRTTLNPPHQLTCRALQDSPSPAHELLSVEPA